MKLGEETVLSIDVGTTALKGVLLARSGELLADGEGTLQTSRSSEGHLEQDPDSWWRALATLCNEWTQAGVELRGVRALVLSGQMQDLVLTREAVPAAPAILYSDARAVREVDEAASRLGLDPALATGNPFTAASLPPKLLWLSRHAPQTLTGRPRLHVGAKDVLIERLCGAHVTDHTAAATTGLYDLARGRWYESWMDTLAPGVQLPRLRWPCEVAGLLFPGPAESLGLPESIPVLTGLGDAGATTLGAGVSRAGERYLYLGTSGWVGTVISQRLSRAGEGFRLPLLNLGEVLAVAPISNAGSAHRWAAQTFAGGSYEELERLMMRAPASDLLCLPSVKGEHPPVNDPRAWGIFHGVDPRTDAGTLAHAVLEGVAFALRQTAERLGTRRPEQQTLTVLGGGTRSVTWRKVIADVFGMTVRVPGQAALLPVLGGAYPAFRHLGWTGSVAEYQRQVLTSQERALQPPSPALAAHYDLKYARFQELSARMGPLP